MLLKPLQVISSCIRQCKNTIHASHRTEAKYKSPEKDAIFLTKILDAIKHLRSYKF